MDKWFKRFHILKYTHVDYPAEHANGIGAVEIDVRGHIFNQTSHDDNNLHIVATCVMLILWAQRETRLVRRRSRKGLTAIFGFKTNCARGWVRWRVGKWRKINLCRRRGFRELLEKQKQHPSKRRLQKYVGCNHAVPLFANCQKDMRTNILWLEEFGNSEKNVGSLRSAKFFAMMYEVKQFRDDLASGRMRFGERSTNNGGMTMKRAGCLYLAHLTAFLWFSSYKLGDVKIFGIL